MTIQKIYVCEADKQGIQGNLFQAERNARQISELQETSKS